MHKRRFLSVILAVFICCTFSSCRKVTKSEYLDSTETDADLRAFSFESAQEIESISDEDLIYLSQHSYEYARSANSVFLNGTFERIDYFEVPLMRTTNSEENVRTEILYSDENYNTDTPLTADKIKPYAEETIKDAIRCQNTMEPGDDAGIIVTDEEIIYCGENDSYIEYSGRYVDNRYMYENDFPVTHIIPRATRWVFMKNIVSDANGNDKLIGELSKEYIQEQMDIFKNDSYESEVVYREVTEDDTAFYYNYYIASFSYGDWGVDSSATLYKRTHTIDKETHIISYGRGHEEIKTVTIPNSTLEDRLGWN